MRGWITGLVAAASLLAAGAARAEPVEIDYWQYTFKERVEAIDELIRRFKVANPDITVRHTNVPYDNYRTRIAATIPAGEGPDVAQLYYGWLDAYIKAGLLQPLPPGAFDTAAIDREFFPIVASMKREGTYYALPTAVRSLSLFWNKKIFADAGLDPEKPPRTLDEMLAVARRTTKRDAGGNMLIEGVAADMAGQDQHWVRESLIREFGGTPYTPDGRRVAYTGPEGVAAVTWYTDLITRERVSELGFMTDQVTAFKAGRAALTVDGSFRLGSFDAQRGLSYGVAELPSYNGRSSNFASFWVNGITAKAKGAKRDAAVKFLQFITTEDAMKLWLDKVGELPARVALAHTDAVRNHPKYGPFVRGLDNAVATEFVDESAQRKLMMDLVDRIVLKKMPVADSLAVAAAEEQKVLDSAR
jgi:multiple sugar transport system substrate-binding protein